jgi:hypothetical protein
MTFQRGFAQNHQPDDIPFLMDQSPCYEWVNPLFFMAIFNHQAVLFVLSLLDGRSYPQYVDFAQKKLCRSKKMASNFFQLPGISGISMN